ncbi:MAG: TetR/AcrR family transcriptional regulator [Gammaproteobacteria bacterium]
MPRPTKHDPERGDARTRLLEAALDLIRAKGYTATTVSDLCKAAGVTSGAFFHNFASKEALGEAAAVHWTQITAALFRDAPYHAHADPLERIRGYIAFRRSLIAGDPAAFTCLAGTMTQEVYATHPAIRDACAASMFAHAATLEGDIAAAMAACGIDADWTAASLARYTQAVLQGAFVLAKASGDGALAQESIDHLERYIDLLFQPRGGRGAPP